MSNEEVKAEPTKKINVTEAFRYSLCGMIVTDYNTGVQEVPARVAEYAITNEFGKAAK